LEKKYKHQNHPIDVVVAVALSAVEQSVFLSTQKELDADSMPEKLLQTK
jgi:hypothetical protein